MMSSCPETQARPGWTAHWLNYGKLIPTSDRRDLVVNREHHVTGRSAGFPDALADVLRPALFLGKGSAPETSLHPRFREIGAFLYRPVRVAGTAPQAAFARFLTPPDPYTRGRDHSRLAVLLVPLEDWSVDLIPAAFAALFEGPLGRADRDDTADRQDRTCPILSPRPLPSRSPDALIVLSDATLPPVTIDAPDYWQGVAALRHLLSGSGRDASVLRELPFAFGTMRNTSASANAPMFWCLPDPASRATGLVIDGEAALPLAAQTTASDLVSENGTPTWTRACVSPSRPLPVSTANCRMLVESITSDKDLRHTMALLGRCCPFPQPDDTISVAQTLRAMMFHLTGDESYRKLFNRLDIVLHEAVKTERPGGDVAIEEFLDNIFDERQREDMRAMFYFLSEFAHDWRDASI